QRSRSSAKYPSHLLHLPKCDGYFALLLLLWVGICEPLRLSPGEIENKVRDHAHPICSKLRRNNLLEAHARIGTQLQRLGGFACCATVKICRLDDDVCGFFRYASWLAAFDAPYAYRLACLPCMRRHGRQVLVCISNDQH